MSIWTSVVVCLLALMAAEPPRLRVNGQAPPPQAWTFLLLTRGVDGEPAAEVRARLQDQWIERYLIAEFLKQQKVVAPPDLVDLRVYELEELIGRRGAKPADLYAKVGLSPEQVREELALGAAWETYVEQSVTGDQLRAYFDRHKAELDGTRVRVSQIFLKGTSPAERAAAVTRLKQVRQQIASGQQTFAAAAKAVSQSPSGQQGGDVGWVLGRGQLPVPVSQAALALQVGELSEPVESPAGTHLVTVTERQPGQLSREDARPQILEQLGQLRWSELAARLRSQARVETSQP